MRSENWPTKKLEEICLKITDGSHFSPKGIEKNGYPMASIKDLTENGVNLDACKKISEEDFNRLVSSGCQPLVDDVLIAKDGNSYLEHVVVNREKTDFVVLSSIAILRPNKQHVLPYYLKYYFKDQRIKNLIKRGYVSGSAIPRIVLRDFKKFPVILPPLQIQKQISEFLLIFDKKIELNHQINQNLEEMAQAIFKSWFIDFEPFQDGEFVESELGMIPKGWEVKSLDEIAHYLNGLAMQKYRPTTEDYLPVIKIKELRQGFTTSDSDKATNQLDTNYIVNDGDVLFSWSGTLEVKIWCGGKGALNQHLFKVTSKEYEKWFYYYWIKFHLERFRRIAEDRATTLGHIRRKDLSDSKVLIPDRESLQKLSSMIKPIFDQIITLKIQSRKLKKVRDTLLPKLMSGEIRVPLEEVTI